MSQRHQFERSTVPVERSKEEIRQLLLKHGSQYIQWTEGPGAVQLMFALKYLVEGKEMVLPIRITVSMKNKREQSVYRALYHHLLAQWTAIDFGIVSLEEAFLPWVVLKLPGGDRTVGEAMLPGIRKGIPTIDGLRTAMLLGEAK